MRKRQTFLILFLVFIQFNLFSQKFGVDYTTTIDSINSKHLLTFKKDGNVSVRFILSPGVYWGTYEPVIFKFSNTFDTIRIFRSDSSKLNEDSKILLRILNSKFIIKPHNQLFDLNSGFTYVDNNCTKKTQFGVIAIDNKIYKISKHRQLSGYSRKINSINLDQYKINILRGKEAIDKYGLKGINGVVELIKIE
jgi:hypothetical protein